MEVLIWNLLKNEVLKNYVVENQYFRIPFFFMDRRINSLDEKKWNFLTSKPSTKQLAMRILNVKWTLYQHAIYICGLDKVSSIKLIHCKPHCYRPNAQKIQPIIKFSDIFWDIS